MKLPKDFYQRPAFDIAKSFLGKYLVHQTSKGIISGQIIDVEAYPANIDNVSHGNKRTKRTEIMYQQGSYAYVYVIYGIHHQLAVVVNKPEIPEVLFIRAAIPDEGIDLMKQNFGRPVRKITDLAKSPGNLCKSFGITLDYYGMDLTGNVLYLEDRGVIINPSQIKTGARVGINTKLHGSDHPFRYYVS